MPSLKDLRNRISSVKNTQKITKTMKMVAAAKVRRAQNACEKSRPYADRLNSVLNNLAASVDKTSAPLLLAGRKEVKTVRILAFGSDRGLCGGFNGQIAKEVLNLKATFATRGIKTEVVTLGKKPKDALKSSLGKSLVATFDDVTADFSYATAENIGMEAVQAFVDGKCDRVIMVYNTFVNMLTQKVTVQQLAPFTGDSTQEDAGTFGVEYEPEEETILNELLPKNVSVQIFKALLESSAAEQAARMTAMDNATNNAGDMIKKLSLVYNRSRQAAITSELCEIVAGAEAL